MKMFLLGGSLSAAAITALTIQLRPETWKDSAIWSGTVALGCLCMCLALWAAKNERARQ